MAVIIRKIKYIKINEILPNPYQVRRVFERKALFELADSIKENGLLSPVIVRGGVTGYELVCGQRRLRAASIAGKTEVPAIVIKAGDAECAALSLAENTKRCELSLFEEAEGLFNLLSYHRVKKEKTARMVSANLSEINEKVRLLSLSESVRFKAEEKGLHEKYIRELLKIHDEKRQLEIIDLISAKNLSVGELRKIVKNDTQNSGEYKRREKTGKTYGDLSVRMPLYVNTVKKTVELLKKSGAYITQQESDDEDFTEFVIRIHKI